MNDDLDPLAAYNDLTDRPWWPLARTLLLIGQNVIVFDPARSAPIERWSSRVEHGTVQVLPRLGPGWCVSVYEIPMISDDLSDYTYPEDTDESEAGDTPMPAPPRVRP